MADAGLRRLGGGLFAEVYTLEIPADNPELLDTALLVFAPEKKVLANRVLFIWLLVVFCLANRI